MNVILKNFNRTITINSKFEREIGDEMRIDGEPYEVIFVGSDDEVSFIMRALKSIRNKERRNAKKNEDAILFGLLNEARLSVNESLPKEHAIGISTVKQLMNL